MEMRPADLMKRHQNFGGNLPLSQIGLIVALVGSTLKNVGRRNTEKGKRSWPVGFLLSQAAHAGKGKQ